MSNATMTMRNEATKIASPKSDHHPPPKKICTKMWVPTVEEKTINCVRYEKQCVTKMIPYTVCRHVT